MAKINFYLGDIIGKVGGLVFQRGSSGSILRSKGAAVDPKTYSQTLQRSRFADISRTWTYDLTSVQRADWNTLASSVSNKDVFGLEVGMTGQQLFARLNSNWAAAGYGVVLPAPANLNVSALNLFQDGTFRDGASDCDPSIDPVLGINEELRVDGVINLSPAINYVADRLVNFGYFVEEEPTVVVVPIPERFGTLSEGQVVWLRAQIFNAENGMLSAPLLRSWVVTPPV